ncbi:hypothetical protein [Streptomyces sp. NPDC003635]
MRRPRLPQLRGLRIRLVVAFALVTALTAAATGTLTFREARNGVLQQSQDTVIQTLRAQVGRLAEEFAFPPSENELVRFATEIARADPSGTWRVLVTYGGLSGSSVPDETFEEISPDLRSSVGSSLATVFQRVRSGEHTALVVGMSVTFASSDGGAYASGVRVFLTVPQTTERAYVDALVTAVERATVPALALAVLLGCTRRPCPVAPPGGRHRPGSPPPTTSP